MTLEYLPPRPQHEITIDGFAVPRIEAREDEKTQITHIVLDGRMGIDIPAELAQPILWLLVNAVAVGAGYSCHGENSIYRPNPFKVKVMEIESRRS